MSSYNAHLEGTSPLSIHEARSGASHQTAAMPECVDGIQTQDEVSSDNTDENFDDGEEFRDKARIIRKGAYTPYNPMNEALPRLPVYHPSFLKAVNHCSELMERAALVLTSAEYKDGRILQLIDKASNSKSLEFPRPRLVGLIGDSGVGKSSLINALLDTPDIALSGASGEACTNVITEYHQAQTSQKAPFTAEIALIEEISMKRMLAKYIGWYYSYVHDAVETMDQEAVDELKAQAQTTTETFQALFADRDEFSDEERTKNSLEQIQSPSDPEMLQTLYGWIKESISKCGAEDGIIYRSAYAPDELAGETERFVKSCKHMLDEKDCHVPSLWPLVKQVRYPSWALVIVDQS